MRNVTTTKKCAECGLCCYFTKEQVALAPYFSRREIRVVNKNKLRKNENGTFQAKALKSRKRKGFFVCQFLNEEKYKCSIYKKRPLDCVTWPFIAGWDKGKKDVYLWIADQSFCSAVIDIKEIKREKMADNVINFLKKKEFFEEIKNGERCLWPYKRYQMKLKKITKFIK